MGSSPTGRESGGSFHLEPMKRARGRVDYSTRGQSKEMDFDKERDERSARQLTFTRWADSCLEVDRERTKRTDSDALEVSSWQRDSRSCDHLNGSSETSTRGDYIAKIDAYISMRTKEGIIRGWQKFRYEEGFSFNGRKRAGNAKKVFTARCAGYGSGDAGSEATEER